MTPDESQENSLNGFYVIGMSCRAPSVASVEQYWNSLQSCVDMVSTTERRWPAGIYGLPNSLALLDDIISFDASYFNVSPEQAGAMDPQIRLLLEVASEAVFDSGLPKERLSTSRCGIYTAVMKSEVQSLGNRIEECCTAMHASKLAKLFNISGPSVCIDCACSSALVAVHFAYQDFLLDKIDYALVTATSILLSPNQSLQNLRLGMSSTSGKCHVWDESADGYVRAEGIFAVLLAKGRDQGRLYAEIVASSTNSDGYKPEGITYPSRRAQFQLLKSIYDDLPIEDLVYIECHATGTQAGDPEETAAICELLKDKNLSHSIFVGSCKSNHGHAEWAAGLASFIKAVLCIHHQRVVPNLHLRKLNPRVEGIAEGKLIPVIENYYLEDGLVGITALGFGGSNCHVVIKPVKIDASFNYIPKFLLLLTASRTGKGLHDQLEILGSTDCPFTLAHISKTFGLPSNNVGLPFRQAVIPKVDKNYSLAFCQTSSVIPEKTKNQIWFLFHDFALIRANNDEVNILECLAFRNLLQEVKSREIGKFSSFTTSSSPPSSRNFPDILSLSAAYYFTTVNLLKDSGITYSGLIGAGLSDLICATLDDCICLENTLQLLKIIFDQLNRYEIGEQRKIFEIDSDAETVTKNVWKIDVICYNTPSCVVISFPAVNDSDVRSQLDRMNISYRELSLRHGGLYTKHMLKLSHLLSHGLNPNLVRGKRQYRTTRWINTHRSIGFSHFGDNEPINPAYIGRLLKSTIYLDTSKINIPKNSIIVNLGLSHRPNWIPENEIYINCTNYQSILQALGQLFLLGYDVLPKTINGIEEKVPRGSMTIGHFMQWDHSHFWPVPHWIQFSLTFAKDKLKNTFVFQWDGQFVSMLHAVWRRINLTYQTKMDSLIELMDIEQQCANVEERKFILHVLPALGKFKTTNVIGDQLIMEGRFRFRDILYFHQKITMMKGNSNTLSIEDDCKMFNTTVFEFTWTDDWLNCLRELFSKLEKLLKPHGRKFCLNSICFCPQRMPKAGNLINFNIDIVCGYCIGLGIIIQMAPIVVEAWNCNIYPRTSSNISLIPLPLDDSSILSTKTDSSYQIDVHLARIYQLQGTEEDVPSWLLVCCGKNADYLHNFSLSIITEDKTTPLINAFQVPDHVSCLDGISLLVPYLLSCSVIQTFESSVFKFMSGSSLVIATEKIDYLLFSLLSLFTSYSLPKLYVLFDVTVNPNISNASSSISLPRTANPSPPYTKSSSVSNQFLSPNSNETTQEFLTSTPSPSTLCLNLSLEEKESSLHLSSTQQTLIPPEVIENLYPGVKFMMNRVESIVQIGSETKSETFKQVISLHPDLAKWSQMLSEGGKLIHLGSVKSHGLGIGICSSFSSVYPLSANLSLTKMAYQLDDASLDGKNDSWAKLFQLYDHLKILAPPGHEDTVAYKSSSTVCFSCAIGLNVVQKHIQKKLKTKSDKKKDYGFVDLSWLGKLVCISHDIQTSDSSIKRSPPMFESPLSDHSSPVFRRQTQVPRVHCMTPEMEKDEKIVPPFFTNVEDSFTSFLGNTLVEAAVPLAKPADQSVLLHMNAHKTGEPLFLVHPVTGVLNYLRPLAACLPVPCYGLQQTEQVPSDSLEEMARFYLQKCIEVIGDSPLKIIGYSFGGCVAFLMALEAQKQNVQVANLILLDGSPLYVKMPLNIIRNAYPQSMVQKYLDAEMLLAFLQVYGNIEATSLRTELVEAPDRQSRVNIAVNHLLVCEEPSPIFPKRHVRWKKATRQILHANRQRSVFTATQTLLLKQRTRRANIFMVNMDLVDKMSMPTEKFRGNVHLLRISDPPAHCPTMPYDYGVTNMIDGNLRIMIYKASHESLVFGKIVHQVAKNIVEILQ